MLPRDLVRLAAHPKLAQLSSPLDCCQVEGNFGGNQLLEGSISLSPLYPHLTNDLPLIPQSFQWGMDYTLCRLGEAAYWFTARLHSPAHPHLVSELHPRGRPRAPWRCHSALPRGDLAADNPILIRFTITAVRALGSIRRSLPRFICFQLQGVYQALKGFPEQFEGVAKLDPFEVKRLAQTSQREVCTLRRTSPQVWKKNPLQVS